MVHPPLFEKQDTEDPGRIEPLIPGRVKGDNSLGKDEAVDDAWTTVDVRFVALRAENGPLGISAVCRISSRTLPSRHSRSASMYRGAHLAYKPRTERPDRSGLAGRNRH